MAVHFFDNFHFYIDKDRVEICRRRRESTLGNMTLQEVYRKFALDHVGGVERGPVSLANAIGAVEAPVLKVFDAVDMSLDDQLNAKHLMASTGDDDLDLFQKHLVQTLPTPEGNWKRTIDTKNSQNKKKRALSLAIVLGSSGSGITFFSFQYLAPEFLRKKRTDEEGCFSPVSKSNGHQIHQEQQIKARGCS